MEAFTSSPVASRRGPRVGLIMFLLAPQSQEQKQHLLKCAWDICIPQGSSGCCMDGRTLLIKWQATSYRNSHRRTILETALPLPPPSSDWHFYILNIQWYQLNAYRLLINEAACEDLCCKAPWALKLLFSIPWFLWAFSFKKHLHFSAESGLAFVM